MDLSHQKRKNSSSTPYFIEAFIRSVDYSKLETTMEINLSYNSLIEFEGEPSDDQLPLIVKGKSCNAGFIESKMFIIPRSELNNIASTLKKGIDGHGGYLLKDHGFTGGMFGIKSVDNVIGRINQTSVVGDDVLYEARLEDADMADKIRKKLVTSSSVGLKVNQILCTICARGYDDPECTHFIGQEYPEEGLHEIAKDYLSKPVAALFGKDIEGKEQSVVLFPAIKGASVGLNFSEEAEKLFSDIEEKKLAVIGGIDTEVELDNEKDTKISQLTAEVADLKKELGILLLSSSDNIDDRSTMTDDFDIESYTKELTDVKADNIRLTDDLADAKLDKTSSDEKVTKLETEVTDLKAKLDSASEIVDKYKADEKARIKVDMDDKIEKLSELRKDKKLPDKDYSSASLEVLKSDLELLESLPTAEAQGQAATGDMTDEEKNMALKAEWKKRIFGDK